MRGPTGKLVVVALIGLVVGEAWAAGPQFTGLLQDFYAAPADTGHRRSSIATMDPDGPISSLIPLAGERWSDVVVAPSGAYFAIENESYVYRIDSATMTPTKLVISGVGVDTDWLVGLTWDTTRNRLVVGSLSGEGFLFGYFDSSNQWNVISSLHQLDLRSIAYRSSNDTLYGLQQQFVGATNMLFKYDSNGQQVGSIQLSEPIAGDATWGLDGQMVFASDGQLAVWGPEWVKNSSGDHIGIHTMLYLINPDTGAVTYQGVLPIPEPGVIGVLLAVAAVAGQRTRRALPRSA
jgi:hypothetical protein